MLSAPAWCPSLAPAPRALAQRRLPSSMTPTWRGTDVGVELPGEATGVGGIEDVAQPHAPCPPACSGAAPRGLRTARPTLLRARCRDPLRRQAAGCTCRSTSTSPGDR